MNIDDIKIIKKFIIKLNFICKFKKIDFSKIKKKIKKLKMTLQLEENKIIICKNKLFINYKITINKYILIKN